MSLPVNEKDKLNNFLEIMEKINNKMKELGISDENFAEILKVYINQI
ncbi:hypothetical protein IX317_001100 [Fusobacterium sp. DD29]|nr:MULTISPECIES: hypothetical protein [unclassified Fusobacterium]MBR8749426.1 hypothetical protein [Fusobacterium sp. DD29]MBR8761684.1 hypothetical protein [Fusobacterium sp. DD25]MBR8767724.1 hypothetical protein [Fusobacterium sp. DD43]MBR8771728.1 hypothetical protein [Fusobacterium sp. DD40]MBR8776000.1 hypothetical protein [Fusobacterium sp. DD17]